MKKISLVLATLCGATLVACNGGSSSPDTTPSVDGLNTSFSGGNNFVATTEAPSITKTLTLSNSGESDVSKINFTLPTNNYFTVSNDEDTEKPCIVDDGKIENTLKKNDECTLKVTYNNPTVTSSSSANIVFNYTYGENSEKTQKTSISYVTTYVPSNKVKYVVVGSYQNVWYSLDGNNWTNLKVPSDDFLLGLNSVIYGKNGFVAVSTNGTSYVSVDGKIWSGPHVVSDQKNLSLKSIIFANDQYVAVGHDGNSYISTDGKAWTSHTIASDSLDYFDSIAYGNGYYIAVGENLNNQLTCVSQDAKSWACQGQSGSSSTEELMTVSYGNGIFVTAGNRGTGYYSDNYGISWTQSKVSSSVNIRGSAYGNNTFVAVGSNYSFVSSDGTSWSPHIISGMAEYDYPHSMIFDGSKFWSVTDNSYLYSSNDGVNWSKSNRLVGGSGSTTSAIAYAN